MMVKYQYVYDSSRSTLEKIIFAIGNLDAKDYNTLLKEIKFLIIKH